MAVRWRIPFYIRGGSRCTINIHDDDYSGSVTVLKGSPSPFVVSEDDDKDAMLPVRISSGHISIIAESDISDIFPDDNFSRFVTLTSGSSTLWQGYIEPSSNDLDWNAFPLEVNIPIISCIGALANEEIPVDSNGFGLLMLRELLKKAFVASGTGASTFVFPNEWTGGNILDAKVQEFAFFSEGDISPESPDFRKYEGQPYLTILETIMTFLGWTLYERGSQIIAVSRTATRYNSVQISQLDAESPTFMPLMRQIVSLPAIAGDNHSQSITQAAGNITINAEADEVELFGSMFSHNANGVTFGNMIELGSYSEHQIASLTQSNLVGYIMQIDQSTCLFRTHTYQLHYTKTGGVYGIDLIQELSMPFERFMSLNDSVNPEDPQSPFTHYGAQFYHADLFNKNVSKESLSYSNFIAVVSSVMYDATLGHSVGLTEAQLKSHPVLEIKSKAPISSTAGIICLNGEMFSEMSEISHYWVQLKIGSQYYNGTYWTESESWFDFDVNNNDKSSWDVYQEYNDAKGTIISLETAHLGKMIEIKIAPKLAATETSRIGSLRNFDVKEMLPDSYNGDKENESNKYYLANTAKGEPLEVDLSLLTMNENKPCYNCLWWGNDYLKNQLSFNGEAMRPEVALSRKYLAIHGAKREILQIECELTEIVPYNIIRIGSAAYAILAAENDYSEKKTTLTLIST